MTTKARFLDRTTHPRIFTLVLAAAVGSVGMNIVLPALVEMAEYFETDYVEIQYVVTGYLGATALLQLVIGPLSDRYGRRPLMLWGFGLFVIATLWCAMATTYEYFLAARVMQSVVATGMVMSRTIVRDMYNTDKAASMIGYVTMGMAIAPMMGPALGGYLSDWYGWQSIFYMMAAAGVLTLVVMYFDLGETNVHKSSSMTKQFRDYPGLFGCKQFWGYCLSATFASGAFFSFLGGGPLVATTILHLTPVELGNYLILLAGGYMMGSFFSGRFSEKAGIRKMVVIGASIAFGGVSITLFFLSIGIFSALTLFLPILLVGLGNGVCLPNATSGFISAQIHLAGSASGLGGAMMIGGGTILAIITGNLMTVFDKPWALLGVMWLSTFLGVVCAIYIYNFDKNLETTA